MCTVSYLPPLVSDSCTHVYMIKEISVLLYIRQRLQFPPPPPPPLQSQIAVYDVDSGQKHSVKPVEIQNRGVALVRHIVALEGAQVVCSVGKEVHIITCDIKLKNE